MNNGVLRFYFGVVGAGKTRALLDRAQLHGSAAFLVKHAIDTRWDTIRSRAGVEQRANLITDKPVLSDFPRGIRVVLVDEAQFFDESAIEVFRELADQGLTVQCYGLRTDYKGRLFEGSRRLFELADWIEEIGAQCAFCERSATMSLKTRTGSGKLIELDGEDLYKPACSKCYKTLNGMDI